MAEPTARSTRPIDAWCNRLRSATPIFSRTVTEVTRVTGNARTNARDLSQVIGRDASLATRLLRIAGSSLFNLQRRDIDTIDNAVVLMGFDTVNELALSLTLIEQVLQGQQHERVIQTMARGFHAATQAKGFAVFHKDKAPEEVFVAALLRELGRMAFWAHCGEEGDAIDGLIANGTPLDKAEKQVLGFSTEELTAELTSQWHLGELLRASVSGPVGKDPRLACIALGHEVARTTETHGWNSSQTKRLIKRIAKDLDLKEGEVTEQITESREAAEKIAARYGVANITAALPSMNALPGTDACSAPVPRAPDTAKQLEAMQAISAGLDQQLPLSELIARVLSGIHDGVGFDRTYFALLSQDRSELEMRFALGANCAPLGASRPLGDSQDPFTSTLQSGQTQCFALGEDANQPEDLGWLAFTPCALMPVLVNNRPVGVLYGDRAASGGDIDEPTLGAFRMFGQQIVAALTNR